MEGICFLGTRIIRHKISQEGTMSTGLYGNIVCGFSWLIFSPIYIDGPYSRGLQRGTGMQTTIEGPLTGPRQKGLDVSSFHPQRLRNFVNLFMPSYAWLLRPQVGESHPVQCKSKKNSSSKLSEHMAIGYYSSNIDMLGTPRLLRYIFVFFLNAKFMPIIPT